MRAKFSRRLCLFLILALTGCHSKDSISVLKPSGPIVQVPPAITFNAGPNGAAGSGKVTPEMVGWAEEMARTHKNDPKGLSDSGSVIAASGDRERGRQLLEQSVQMAPRDPQIIYNYARILYELGRMDEALRQIQTALSLQPQFKEAALFVAIIYVAKQDYDAADAALGKLPGGQGESVDLLIVRGVILYGHNSLDEALKSFERAKELAPDDAIALYDLGVAYQQKNDLANAEKYYRQAIEKDPDLAEAHNNLGTVLALNGKLDESFEEIHKAVQANSDDPTFVANLAATMRDDKGSADALAGDWVLESGTIKAWGTVHGQHRSQTFPLPGGSHAKFTKIGEGEYQAVQTLPNGASVTTTVHRQANGSYEGAAVAPPGLPPGVTVSGKVTFWQKGDVLFGDTTGTTTGPDLSIQEAQNWKARRRG